ncbi:MAG: biotin--[acetyl-CoA-carboxylase] ligase [Alphaproteobacteria bacterium]
MTNTQFWQVIALEETGSTNQDASRFFCEQHIPAPFLVTAKMQHAGKGRQGRHWVSPVGNFYGSFVYCPRLEGRFFYQASFVAAVALAEAMQQLLTMLNHHPNISVKWPNDVLLGGCKMAGILTEIAETGTQQAIIMGIGVNLAAKPDINRQDITALALHLPSTANNADIFSQFNCLLQEKMAFTLQLWEEYGFMPIKEKWLTYCQMLDQPIMFHPAAGQIIEGVFVGLGDKGQALINTASGLQQFWAGDVDGPKNNSNQDRKT